MTRHLPALLLIISLVVPRAALGQVAPEEPGVAPPAPAAGGTASQPASAGQPEEIEDQAPPPPRAAPPRKPAPRRMKPAPSPPKKLTRPRNKLASAATRTLFVGGGLTFGFFYPGDVNDHMQSWQNSQGAVVIQQSGFTGMVLNLVPRLAVSVVPVRFLEITGMAEVGWGPKIITVLNADSEFFNFMRYSGGATLNAHIPISDRRDSIFLGGGVIYHHLSFQEFSADAVGFRGQAGYKMFTNSLLVEGFLAFDYTIGDTGMPKKYGDGEMSLNYTSVQIGFNVYYGII